MSYWLTGLPAHWGIRSLQYVCDIETGERDTVDAVDDGPIPFYIRSQEIHTIDSPTHEGEAVLTPGDGAVGEVFHHHRRGPFAAHQRVYVLRNFKSDIWPRFFFWAFSATFRNVTQPGTAKSTVESLRRPMFTSFPVPVPPFNEQQRIADFLDRETAEIDAMDTELDRLVETLRERQRSGLLALGHHLSGPGDRTRIGYLLVKQTRVVHAGDGVVTAFRDGQVTLRSKRREEGFTVSFTESGYQGVEPGDFVFHGLDGFAGAVGVSEERGKTSPVYHVCSATEHTSEVFMAWALRAMAASGQLEAYAWSVRQRSVDYRNWATFAGLPITYVEPSEQARIVAELDERTAQIGDMVADANRLKALLAERRLTLITEAVTGLKEVPA